MLDQNTLLSLISLKKRRLIFFAAAFIIILFFLVMISNSILADNAENYQNVYQYDEESNQWILINDEPEDANATLQVFDPYLYFGNSPIKTANLNASAIIDWSNLEHEVGDNPGKLTITVVETTDNIERREDGVFVVPEKEVAGWKFIYRIENISDEGEIMYDIELKDSFGAELDVIEYRVEYQNGVIPGEVKIWTQGEMDKYFFEWVWGEFDLHPGQWAELIIYVETGKNPAGIQEYTTGCNYYDLNSEARLRYRKADKPGWNTRYGEIFRVKVTCICLDVWLSANSIDWYIRKPGDYYAEMITGTVRASHPVAVTFRDFDDLVREPDKQRLPVYYILNNDNPQIDDWITPAELNDEFFELPASQEGIEWNLWQRIKVLRESYCDYNNKGVITFTLLNMEDSMP